MKTLLIRQIDDPTYQKIKDLCARLGTSLNRFVVETLKKIAGTSQTSVYQNTDFDDFFGTWSRQEHKAFNKEQRKMRTIDKELWK